jgi:hypothetical protein
MTPSVIEHATSRLVAQCLNQLRHRVPPGEDIVHPKLEVSECIYTCPLVAIFMCLDCNKHETKFLYVSNQI